MNIQLLRELHKRELLLCGGAAGHLAHLSDDPDLTFAEIKDVLSKAAEGKLESVTEKLDGVNLVFTWNTLEGGLRVARAGSEIKQGGLDAEALARKFSGRANVLEAFNIGFDILNRAVSSLPENLRSKIFLDGNLWYSMELIYSGLANTINYDSNNIVFHQSPVFKIDDDGAISTVAATKGVEILASNIDKMQSAISNRGWQVRGPALVRLKKISDGSILNAAYSKIDDAMAAAGVSNTNTLQEYLYNMVVNEASDLGVGQSVVKAIAARIANMPGAPNLNQLKKMVPPEQISTVQDFVKAEKTIKHTIMKPIELAIHDFALEVLKGLESALIADSEGEVQRLRSTLQSAIEKIQASGHHAAMDVLTKEMGKLQSIENIGSPMEGIVFMYKGKAFKFTGAFQPAHQILSLFSFGRKDIPSSLFKTESYTKQRIIREGGHAFPDVQPLSLDDYDLIWPSVENHLKKLGLKNIKPIGTTGKKDPMGDVDIAAETPESRDAVFDKAIKLFGNTNVVKVGSNIISINYQIDNKSKRKFQLDVMLGDTDYLSWARYGPSPDSSHKEFSVAKGALRNVMLNIILRFLSQKEFAAEQSELERVKYVIDFDEGMFLIRQSRRGNNNQVLKTWKTIDKEFITKNPNEIMSIIFDVNLQAQNLLRLEDLFKILRSSKRFKSLANEIIQTFLIEIEELSHKNTKMFGSNPEKTLKALRSL